MNSEKLAKAIETFVFQSVFLNKRGASSYEEHISTLEAHRKDLEQGIWEAQQDND